GTGEGHRPWDLMPGSTMTNANVDSEVAISDGKKLVPKYKDGDKTFIVPDNVKVVMFAPGTAADVKPGAKIFIVAAKKLPDGTLEAPGAPVSGGGGAGAANRASARRHREGRRQHREREVGQGRRAHAQPRRQDAGRRGGE